MDFKKYLQANAQSIDEELDLILTEFLEEAKKTSPKLVPFALGLINSCQGGKRIRGVLVKLGYEISSGKGEEIFRISAAMEILHSAILIQDDIIDQSPTRRGQPSLFKSLGGGHRGQSLALAIGDVGLYFPIQIISEANFLDKYKMKALSYLSQVVVNTAWGQVLELDKREDINLIQRLKTAYYTVSGPLQLGAILGGVDPTSPRLRRVKEFGESLGIAFQIQDDILDKEVDYLGGVINGKKEALKYVTEAKKVIPRLTKDKKMSTLLEQMCEYMVERSK